MESHSQMGRLYSLMLQGAAVLVSILLAFAVDAWWSSLSDRTAETELLESLRTELSGNRTILEEQVIYSTAIQASALSLLALSSGRELEVSADSVEQLLSDLTWWAGGSWETATVDALISSGDLSLVKSRALRRQIAGWARAIEEVSQAQGWEIAETRDRWIPFLTEGADLVALGRAGGSAPGTGEAYEAALALPQTQPFDHRPLLRDRELRNLLVTRYWSLADLHVAYVRFAEALQSVLTATELELRK